MYRNYDVERLSIKKNFSILALTVPQSIIIKNLQFLSRTQSPIIFSTKKKKKKKKRFSDAKRGLKASILVESTPRAISEKCNGKEESYERAGREYGAIIPRDKAIPLHSRNYVSAI